MTALLTVHIDSGIAVLQFCWHIIYYIYILYMVKDTEYLAMISYCVAF